MNNDAFEQLERNSCLVRLQLTHRKPARFQTVRCQTNKKNTDKINISEDRPQLRIYASCLHIPPVAGKAQIEIVIRPAVLSCYDMFNVKRNERENVLMTSAILASILGTLADQSSCGSVN